MKIQELEGKVFLCPICRGLGIGCRKCNEAGRVVVTLSPVGELAPSVNDIAAELLAVRSSSRFERRVVFLLRYLCGPHKWLRWLSKIDRLEKKGFFEENGL